MIKENRLKPLIKWTGGKEQELKYIHPELPSSFNNYFEPFIGGGAVYFSIDAKKYFINDKSEELINLYTSIKEQNSEFFELAENFSNNWKKIENFVQNNSDFFIQEYISYINLKDYPIKEDFDNFFKINNEFFSSMFLSYIPENFIKELNRNLFNKFKRMAKIDLDKQDISNKQILDNVESSLKSAFYMQVRYLYNYGNFSKGKEAAIFFFIRNFAYSGMFRYNKNGMFNVPYGGIGYNSKDLNNKLNYYKSSEFLSHLNKTNIFNEDFIDFFKKTSPQSDDFIFLDPPYDSTFSTYSKNEFNQEDQKRLADYLLNECKAKWMMVISNTNFIFSLYNKKGITISDFDKKYMVNFKNRNDGNVKHLIIKNY